MRFRACVGYGRDDVLGSQRLQIFDGHRTPVVAVLGRPPESRVAASARSTTLRAKRPFCITSIPWLPSGAR